MPKLDTGAQPTAAKGAEDSVKDGNDLVFEESGLHELAPEKVETEQEKKKREAREKKDRMKEFGGSVSLCKLLSMASFLELLVFFIGVLGALAHGAGQPVLCLMFGDLIDAVSQPDSVLDTISEIAIKFMVIGCIVGCVGSIQGFAFPWFVETQLKKMRPVYFDAALHRDVGWFDTHNVGAFVAEMGEDLDVYSDALGNKLGVSIMSTSCIILGYALGLYLSWQVALMMTVAFPILGLGAAIMGQAMMDITMETQSAYVKAAKVVDEVLFAVRTVVSFGGERRELNRYTEAVEIARKGGTRNRMKTGLGMGYIWLAYFASMALAFWFGMKLVYGGTALSVGNLMSAFFCVLTAGFTVGQIFPGFGALWNARVYMARFFYIKEHDSVIQRRLKEDRKDVGPIDNLELQNVHFVYPARPEMQVLKGLSLSIPKGKKVAVVGESGSGKSTVMALLERFYDPLDGQVLVNGEDLRSFSVRSYRAQIGYVGQEPVLFATSVRQNITQGCPTASEADLKRVAAFAQLDFVSSLPEKFETYVGSGGSQFSGGQKQRIAIARALIKKPSVLFLDEATSALDGPSEKMIQDTIDSIATQSELGMTIVTIAHRLSTVKNSDVIYVLKNGVVHEQGTHSELIAKEGGTYQALAAAQEVAGSHQKQGETALPTQREGAEFKRQVSSQSGSQVAAPGSVKKLSSAEEEEKAREKAIAKTYKVPMGRLLGFCKPEWPFFAPGILAALVSGACFPCLGAFILVDAMVAFIQPDKEKMKREVEKAAIWFVAVGLGKMVATAVQFTSFGILGEAVTKRCRVNMLTSIFRQEIGFHDDPQNTPGRLVKALQVYAYRISVLCISVGDKADALSSVIIGVTLALVSCWEMALAMLLTIPVFAIAQGIQMMVIMGGSQNENAVMKNAAQVVSDAIGNVRTVHAAGNERDLVTLYTGLLESAHSGMHKRNLFSGLAFGLANAVMFWVCSGGFWFMGYLINHDRTDFAGGQRAFMGILYAAMGAGMAFTLTGDAAKAKVACHDLFKFLDRKSLIDGLEPEGVATAQVGRIEFTDVQFNYPFRPEVQVLKGVSFVVEPGQSVGVVGPSGGGKSTVLSMLQRFYDPVKGCVLIGPDKTPLSSLNIRWWRRQVGFVGQEPVLFDMTVLENVKYGLDDGETISSERLEECKRMANLDFLDNGKAQGWDTSVGPKGSRLSGGQKQRVAICRALVRNPPVLLLDEATSALDSKSEGIVQAALEAARRGRTSFAIAHRLSTIQDCDMIIVVAEGRIVEQGRHAELMDLKGVYFKLQNQSASSH